MSSLGGGARSAGALGATCKRMGVTGKGRHNNHYIALALYRNSTVQRSLCEYGVHLENGEKSWRCQESFLGSSEVSPIGEGFVYSSC